MKFKTVEISRDKMIKTSEHIEIENNDKKTPHEILSAVPKMAAKEDVGSVSFYLWGEEFCFGYLDVGSVKNGFHKFDKAKMLEWMLSEVSQLTAYALPSLDTSLNKAFPFESNVLDTLMDTAHGGMNFKSAMQEFKKIERSYMDYLFNTLEYVLGSEDPEMKSEYLQDCYNEIHNNCIDHISNARDYLSDERKQLVLRALDELGMLTNAAGLQVQNAGIYNPWEEIEKKHAMDEGLESGKIVDFQEYKNRGPK